MQKRLDELLSRYDQQESRVIGSLAKATPVFKPGPRFEPKAGNALGSSGSLWQEDRRILDSLLDSRIVSRVTPSIARPPPDASFVTFPKGPADGSDDAQVP